MARFSLRERVRIPTYDDPNEITPGEVSFDHEKCSGCTMCYQACPAGVIRMEGKKATLMARGANECFACGDCIAICPEGAISLTAVVRYSGYFKTIDQGEIEPPRL